MNTKALARFIGYMVALALGAFMTVWGVVHGDPALVTTGLVAAGVGGVAGANTPVRGDHAE